MKHEKLAGLTVLALAVGTLFMSNPDKSVTRTETDRFLANCPGGQNVLYSKSNDHRADLTCADDGTAPRIIPMSKDWNDDDPQKLINSVVLNHPGRVMIELATDVDGEGITTKSNRRFHIEDNAYSPSSIRMQKPIEDIAIYTPQPID